VSDDGPIDEISEADEIADLEAEIAALAESAERCRKFILASQIAIAGGIVLLIVVVFGLFYVSAVSLLGSIALMLGGIVSLGSNISTLRQLEAEIGDAEALRSSLIGRIGLKLVHDAPMKLM
jgi:asparagine N-glycosylation enzyme membrane subunit Stt3